MCLKLIDFIEKFLFQLFLYLDISYYYLFINISYLYYIYLDISFHKLFFSQLLSRTFKIQFLKSNSYKIKKFKRNLTLLKNYLYIT